MLLRIVSLSLVFCGFIFPGYAVSATHHPQDFLSGIQDTPDEGAQIVQHFCATCHAQKPLINLGAPRMGQKKEWEARVKQGLDILLAHTEEGYRAMPARGGCFECSDMQLKKAIQFMLMSLDAKGKT